MAATRLRHSCCTIRKIIGLSLLAYASVCGLLLRHLSALFGSKDDLSQTQHTDQDRKDSGLSLRGRGVVGGGSQQRRNATLLKGLFTAGASRAIPPDPVTAPHRDDNFEDGVPQSLLMAAALEDAKKCLLISSESEHAYTLHNLLKQWPANKPRGFIYVTIDMQRAFLLTKVLQSVSTYFNDRHKYPIVVFSESLGMKDYLKRSVATHLLPSPLYYYDVSERWGPPDYTLSKHGNSTARLTSYSVASIRHSGCLYPSGIGYWLMCRFHAKTITELPFVQAFEYVWRLDADARLCGHLNFDIFAHMKERDYWQGYLAEDEWDSCAQMLTEFVHRFVAQHQLQPMQGAQSIADARVSYVYNNFEIFKVAFYRSDNYTKFIDFIDRSGGFFYYRWGDAPVRTQASRLFMPKEKMHEFKVGEVFYQHQSLIRCSANNDGG